MLAVSFLLVLSVASSVMAADAEALNLHAGSVHVLKIGPIDRVAVGRDAVLGTSVLDNGQLLLIGLASGETDLRVWLKNGSSRSWKVNVSERDVAATVATVAALLESFPKVTVRSINGIVTAEGEVPPDRIQSLNSLISQVPGVVSLLVPKSVSLDTLVRNFPGTRWHDENGTSVVEGEVSVDAFKNYQIAITAFPGVLSLVHQMAVETKPMVRIAMRMLEVNRQAIKNVGIAWDQSFRGPSLGSTDAWHSSRYFRIIPEGLTNPITTGLPLADSAWHAYAGWTTELLSTVNLMQQDNVVTILAEPNLTTRSGASAKFLAGGEIPYPVVAEFGQPSVNFKEYGIRFEIEPLVDASDNIQTQINVDVSTIDHSNAVNGVPGLLKRHTESSITVRPGQTIILSGLVNSQDLRNIGGLAGLSSIPVVGELFKSRDLEASKTEMVILVTPYIEREPAGSHEETHKEIDRMRKLINDSVLKDAIAE